MDPEKIFLMARDSKSFNDFFERLDHYANVPDHLKGRFYVNVSNILIDFSFYEYSYKLSLISLEISESWEDMEGVISCYLTIADILEVTGKYKESIECLNKVLELTSLAVSQSDEYAKRNFIHERACCFIGLGNTYEGLGEFNKAIDSFNACFKLSNVLDDKEAMMSCYIGKGIVFDDLARYNESIECFESALNIEKTYNNIVTRSKCYNGMGKCFRGLMQLEKALEYHNKALAIKKTTHDYLGESKSYSDIGLDYFYLGDYKNTVDSYNYALNIALNVGDLPGAIKIMIYMTAAYQNMGDMESAENIIRQALSISEQIKSDLSVAMCNNELGMVYQKSSDYKKSIKCYLNALRVYARAKAEHLRCGTYINIANLYFQNKKTQKAIRLYNIAAYIADSLGIVDLKQKIYNNLGFIYINQDSEKAISLFKQALGLSEYTEKALSDDLHKITYNADNAGLYRNMINLYVKKGDYYKAFEYLEKSKSRALIELLCTDEAISPTVKSSVMDEFVQKEKKLLIELREYQVKSYSNSTEDNERSIDRIDEIRSRLKELYKKMNSLDPEYVRIRSGEVSTVESIRKYFKDKNCNAVALEYYVSSDAVYIFVISTHMEKLAVEKIEVPKENLVNLIKSDWHDNITEISKYLIEPAAGYIHNSDIVYLIPQEILYNYPLHMLMLNGRSLIENNPVVYDSSTSVLKYQRRNKKSDLKNISIGVGFVKEAEEVSEIIKGELISEEKACKNKIYDYLKDKGIIHFSCHGCYNEKDPLSSGLLLHDGILASRDIFNFKLDAEIVTLSACDTGTNKRTNGDELVGLTRAFLYAGADSVLVSLWKAYAEPTEIFMSEFYGSFINGDTKARAYQKAVIKLKDKYDDFYYWAPFVLYGDCD